MYALVLATVLTTTPEPVEAPTVTLAIGQPLRGALTATQLALADAPGELRGTWTFEIATRSRTPTEVVIPIVVSRGVAITGLQLEAGTAEPLVATALRPTDARRIYDNHVRELIDPALVEWVTDDDTQVLLHVRVFPVARDAPAKVTLSLAMPAGAGVALDIGPTRARTARTRLATDEPAEALAISAVNERWSLIASPSTGPQYEPRTRRLAGDFHDRVPALPTTPWWRVRPRAALPRGPSVSRDDEVRADLARTFTIMEPTADDPPARVAVTR